MPIHDIVTAADTSFNAEVLIELVQNPKLYESKLKQLESARLAAEKAQLELASTQRKVQLSDELEALLEEAKRNKHSAEQEAQSVIEVAKAKASEVLTSAQNIRTVSEAHVKNTMQEASERLEAAKHLEASLLQKVKDLNNEKTTLQRLQEETRLRLEEAETLKAQHALRLAVLQEKWESFINHANPQ